MTPEEKDVEAAVHRFYDALEDLVIGKGTGQMQEAWLHTARVTSGHPTGGWTLGWEQIAASWEELATIATPGNAGGYVTDLKVFVYGDVGYSIGTYVAASVLGGARMSVTNILHRVQGAWKMVHHHADRTPSLDAELEKRVGQL